MKVQHIISTMNRKDFSFLENLCLKTDAVVVNQNCPEGKQAITLSNGARVRAVSTTEKGLSRSRNKLIENATGDICIIGDDDVEYLDGYLDIIEGAYKKYPDADIIIFHFDTDDKTRTQQKYSKTKKHGRFSRMPWGGVRIAVRLSSIKKANVWFTTLFGGGCVFPSGEDSMWLADAKRKGLTFYVSKETIGKVFFDTSTWFTGYDENFFYGKGAFISAVRKNEFFVVWAYYYAFSFRKKGKLTFFEKLKWMKHGREGYKKMLSFGEYKKLIIKGE